ncbi:sulfurtransferase [Sinomonas atrocyanea]|uniref:sulfurtransferase n=1 Tax=Sinomonas atrocyanea TaxID=37927 RepID=UPI00278235D5|nr:sulfurtransferase [Sinomonas atrocyanea]MDQ0258326.1 thiosulfate/3-mercaptopyruvate sulfurtransferase [Sinomonas atrocyanea]MDR6620594.1 thiosulfate/3-mercaptopyruvate sulfurtransferase [Sinomonas atrocyanea]
MNADQVLITAAELAERLARGEHPVLLDVRWSLGGPDGREEYAKGHLPGAVFADLEGELAVPVAPGSAEEAAGGRHPLPSREAFEQAARSWGISDGDAVVVYDATSGQAAARAWWMLRDAGLESVRLLDGGLGAWTAAGGPLEQGARTPDRGNVTLGEGRLPRIGADEAASFTQPRPGAPAGGVLLDARAGERYRGEAEPVDPRAGHIPGALSAPTAENLAPDGTFQPAAALRERFAALGVDGRRPVAVYCGSGVTAAHDVLALAVAGIDAALYPGSFSQWSRDPARPVAVGSEPGPASMR